MLAVILEDAHEVVEDDNAEERTADQIQTAQASGSIQLVVEQDAVNDVPDEQRLDHLQSCSDQRKEEDSGHRVAMRPEPVQIRTQVVALLSFAQPARG